MKKYRAEIYLILGIFLFFTISLLGRSLVLFSTTKQLEDKDDKKCSKIVSLAPSITETLFALGLGNSIVGVTDFCNYPQSEQSINKIGGYFNPNNEAIISLKPSLVIGHFEHSSTKDIIEAAKLNYLVISHESIADIFESISVIAKYCNVNSASLELTNKLQKIIKEIKSRAQRYPKKTVLLSIGRNMGTGSIKDVYITGQRGVFNELINTAGGINAYRGKIAFPIVSKEGILKMNPDIIIDLVPDLHKSTLNIEDVKKEWMQLGSVNAVKNNEVHILTQDYVVIPGPRFVLLLEHLSEIIHAASKKEFL